MIMNNKYTLILRNQDMNILEISLDTLLHFYQTVYIIYYLQNNINHHNMHSYT